MSVGENIRYFRKKANLTQEQLAKKMGVSAQMIYKWENGKSNPKIETVRKIASALDISSFELNNGLIFGNELEKILREISSEKNISYDIISQIFHSCDIHDTIHEFNGESPNLVKENILKIINTKIPILDNANNPKNQSCNANSQVESELLTHFNRLNNIGKQEAAKRIEELTHLEKYINKDYE